ncbi:MAG: hypothetical protein C7B45_01525 [Sulfobacillus acidophilus]|uniref:Glutaconate CoA-transferase n=1 Tax=Sulfobacillus acidophilus TaxID=53633 RepID=A0A2T2WND5_9FIRM|nr:MAG: hypothetical protein C7B45_01525 [Sulfobacillus acidophilus]
MTDDERLVFLMAERLRPDDIVVQGIATPMVFAAFLLARALHAPSLECLFTVGNTYCQSPGGALSLESLEQYTTHESLMRLGMLDIHCDTVPALHVKEFLRPAQVDGEGNTNNVSIGPWHRPRVRLPGAVGIPDVVSFNPDVYLYVTRHDRRTLVDQVDFCSGLGVGKRSQALNIMGKRRRGPRELLTPRAVFRLTPHGPQLTHVAPSISIQDIRETTGFEFAVAGEVAEMQDPCVDALELLRQEIDPWGIRCLEMVSGRDRSRMIRQIVQKERAAATRIR